MQNIQYNAVQYAGKAQPVVITRFLCFTLFSANFVSHMAIFAICYLFFSIFVEACSRYRLKALGVDVAVK